MKIKNTIVVLSSHTPSLFWFRMDMMMGLRERQNEVIAIGNESEDRWKRKFEENGILYRQTYIKRNGTNPLNDLKTYRSLKKLLQEIKPNKVFTYQAKTVIYGAFAASKLGITEIYPMIAGIGSIFIKNDFRTKLIRQFLKAEYRISLKKAKIIFFQNNDDLKVFKSYNIINGENVVMVPGSGVNTDKFQLEKQPEKFGFICISRLIKDKGVYEYLEACKKLKQNNVEARCILVGPFDTNPSSLSKEELQRYIDEDIVEYFGEQEDVRPYIAMSNVLVLPSYREGTPKTNLEAMSMGRAVITTDAPGCRETVVDGINGFLVPVKDVDLLYLKMKTLAEDKVTTCRMGVTGRKMAVEKFDVKIVNDIIYKTMGL